MTGRRVNRNGRESTARAPLGIVKKHSATSWKIESVERFVIEDVVRNGRLAGHIR